MKNLLFEGKWNSDETLVSVKLLLMQFKDENDIHFIYSPHLDLTGYGHNDDQAKEAFNQALEDFIDYTWKKKTIGKVLKSLGWTFKGTIKKPRKSIAPRIEHMIVNNDYISEVFNNYDVHTTHQNVQLPAYA